MMSEEWVIAAHSSGSLTNKAAVLLLLCARMDFDERGLARSWRGRSEMAMTLGVGERAISKAIGSLISDGTIKVLIGGHRGTATVYGLMAGIPWQPIGTPHKCTKHTSKVPLIGSHRYPSGGYPLNKDQKGPGSLDATPPPRTGGVWQRAREEARNASCQTDTAPRMDEG